MRDVTDQSQSAICQPVFLSQLPSSRPFLTSCSKTNVQYWKRLQIKTSHIC